MRHGEVVIYSPTVVGAQYEGTRLMMEHQAWCQEILALTLVGYHACREELGVIREAVLAASLAFNHN